MSQFPPGVPLYKLEQWRAKADAALDGALKQRETDPASSELAAAMQRIGELSMENELLRSWPFGPQEVAVMAAATSPSTGRRYGVARVCRTWEVPRSSFYAAQPPAGTAMPPGPTTRRGPRPAVSDGVLLAAIRADLGRSPWQGEGHRKVWARLRVMDGIRVSRKRVLRLMREHTLLSPHRTRARSEVVHDRHIITEAPNVMWATDATQIITVQDGKIWLFGLIEHWNAELLGWNVVKCGNRYAAAEAVGMAVRTAFGRVGPGAARGLALRHDHGSAFLAEHFDRQVRSWGITPSYAFVGEPETNGVIERFFRTLKEQIVHGRIYQTLDEVRHAVRTFVTRYNAEWLIEKNGLRSPNDTRTAWDRAVMKAAA